MLDTYIHMYVLYCINDEWPVFVSNFQIPPEMLTHMINVTGYWKADHVCTFGQSLFIGPANSHTHTLPVHCCINGLS